jgi:hypothetical protein
MVHNKAQFTLDHKRTFPYIPQTISQTLLKFDMGHFHQTLLGNSDFQLHTDIGEIRNRRSSLICIPLFPLLDRLNKPQRMLLVILYTVLLSIPFRNVFSLMNIRATIYVNTTNTIHVLRLSATGRTIFKSRQHTFSVVKNKTHTICPTMRFIYQ